MDRIGAYQIVGLLHGGPRPLYRAQGADGRVLAMKTVSASGLSVEMRERFNREAAISATFDHPNLIKVYDYGEANGVLFQTMDLLEGGDLSKVFAERRPFTWDEKLGIMEQVCDGLQYAHARNLVHRDIKPANIFLENSGRIRILDFGMARLESSNLTQAGASVGTLNYMAPEQLRAETCTTASDVFSAAMVFYELAGGRNPFAAPNAGLAQIMQAIVFNAPPPLKELAPDMPEGLDFVLNKALEKDPAQRLQNAGDLKQTLALCRITLKLRPAAPKPAAPGAPAAPAPPEDLGKTVVMQRPGVAPMAPRPAAPTPAPAPAPAPPPPKPAAPKPDVVFCTSCTHPNEKGSTVCARCGQPLVMQGKPAVEPQSEKTQWAIIAAVAAGIIVTLFVLFQWISTR